MYVTALAALASLLLTAAVYRAPPSTAAGHPPKGARAYTSLMMWTMMLSLPLGGQLLQSSTRIGTTVAPGIAGWLRDHTGSAAAPVLFFALAAAAVVPCIGGLRALQAHWPIDAPDSRSLRSNSR